MLVDQLEWFVLAVVVVVFTLTLSSSSNRAEDKGHLSSRPVWLGCACQELKAPSQNSSKGSKTHKAETGLLCHVRVVSALENSHAANHDQVFRFCFLFCT